MICPERETAAWEALRFRGRLLPPEDSVGAVALEYVWAYPPGVP